MAKHVTSFHGGHDAVEQMQIRTTNGTGGHFDNRIAPVLNRWIGNRFATDVAFAVPGEGFHARAPGRSTRVKLSFPRRVPTKDGNAAGSSSLKRKAKQS